MFSKRLSPSLDLTERAGRTARETRYQLVARATNDSGTGIWWTKVERRCPYTLRLGTDVGSDATAMNVYTQRIESSVVHNVIDSGGQIWSDEHRFLLATILTPCD